MRLGFPTFTQTGRCRGEALAAQGGRALEPAKLIVPMLSRFMNTDRACTRSKRFADG
ncbi:DUF2274 domain-containing protein [Phenylobacterium sp.]|uniref:DUF2274 domain-containing protein n=1 Tax=Phenylobacterium sp. TaxID=1871053 RepID=UPI0035B2F86D